MWWSSRSDSLQPVSPRRRAPRPGARSQCRRPAGRKLSLERLEARTLLSAEPLPISGGIGIPNPFGGPDTHIQLVGPADGTGPVGGEPSSITDFIGSIGVARVNGTGTDGTGHTLLWDVDMRFMQGVYQGADGNLYSGTFAFV